MSNLYHLHGNVYEVGVGVSFESAITEALALCLKNTEARVQFRFNDVEVNVMYDSDPSLLQRDYVRAIHGCIPMEVSAYPKPTLSQEEQLHDAQIEAENERRRRASQIEYLEQAVAQKKRVETKLADAPQMEIPDQETWDDMVIAGMHDEYASAIIEFASRWARLMQLGMAAGKHLEDVASTTSDEANYDGITGNMEAHAVFFLTKTWRYGEQLRRWYNLEVGSEEEGKFANETEGAIINPTLVILPTKKE